MQTNENTFELGPEQIAEVIFSKPPGELNSINLQLEEQTAEIAHQQGIESFTSNILRIITSVGITILFGNISYMDLNYDQVELIKQYTRSFGYNLIIDVDEEKQQLLIYFERVL